MSEVEDRISWFQQMIAALAGKCTELECKEVIESKKWDTSGLCCVKWSRCSRQMIMLLKVKQSRCSKSNESIAVRVQIIGW